MQARYYAPLIGRFYSNDPVGYTAKNPVMSFIDTYIRIIIPINILIQTVSFYRLLELLLSWARNYKTSCVRRVKWGANSFGKIAVAGLAGAAGVGIARNMTALLSLLQSSTLGMQLQVRQLEEF